MSGRYFGPVLGIILVLLAVSCARLPRGEEGDMPRDKLTQIHSIPAEWGDLIAVTRHVTYPRVHRLWFQDEDGNIRVIGYDGAAERFSGAAMLIRRD